MNDSTMINQLAMVVIFSLSLILVVCLDFLICFVTDWFKRRKNYMEWKRERARQAEEIRIKTIESNRAELWQNYPR